MNWENDDLNSFGAGFHSAVLLLPEQKVHVGEWASAALNHHHCSFTLATRVAK